jgi:ABC-type multidrug transport system ATPase subunit
MRDAHRSFGKNKAVAGVDLQLGTGVFGLLGPNGAGKTSLLRMLATVLPPTSGEIRLLERDARSPAARREIRRRLGYLPQNLGYYPSFTVVEFIEYFALLKVQFRALLRSLGESATVIVSTHLVEDVGAACSEVALMSAGKVVFRGTSAELTARGEGHGVGDAPLERGYSAVLAAARL